MPSIERRLKYRATIVRAIRSYFDDQGFIEVDTPVAISAPAPEPHIHAPAVSLRANQQSHHRFLQTSPELSMKRLLAKGCHRIYQIAPVFRDGDFGQHHRPEFRLLEWYRTHAGWESLLDDCEGLLRHLAKTLWGTLSIPQNDGAIDLSAPFRRISVEEAFIQYAGFSILQCLEIKDLRHALDNLGMVYQPSDSWDDLFFRAWLTSVEPDLFVHQGPLFLTDYPAPLAALAQLKPTDTRVAERVELFIGGLELANGFGELTDSHEQRRRFERDRNRRQQACEPIYPLDERFILGLDNTPKTAGMALGLERLLMLLMNASDIDAVNGLPWEQT